jgi:hypothetical protein
MDSSETPSGESQNGERRPPTEQPMRPEDRRPDAPTDRYIMETRPPYRMLRIKT